jgi:CheY-like chemotaxis protein
LQFSVKDSGIGISADQRACLFRSFSQADQSTTRRYGGTGLGLAISKKLVEALGGNIDVASEVGRGSTFTFSVLLECAAETALSIRESSPDLSGMRVLVVDNNATVREVLSELLAAWSIDVVTVVSGAAAIELFDEASPSGRSAFDLVLLDSTMPEMDGVETARRINLKLTNAVAPLMIMLTTRGGDDSMLQAKELGVDALLAKPVEPSMLLDGILNVINHQSAEEPDSRTIALPNVVRGPHVLVAEDNESNQNLVREILDSAGMTCDIVANGHDAVRFALEQPGRYGVILMDLEMPGMDGLDAAREIRQRAAKQIPIIALTAHAMEQDRQRCLEAGINQHLTKPVNPARLIQEINRWIAPEPVDVEILSALMIDLDALLATNSITAEKHALRLHKELEGQGFDALLNDLEQAIDQLDYPAARTILASLINATGQSR